MRKLILATALSVASLVTSGCGDTTETDTANSAEATGAADGATAEGAAGGGEAASGNASAGTASAAGSWPRGARIVEEGGVTYRVDADGNRVRLGDTDPRIVVENGTRYRVEPGGTRVRIDDRGIDIDSPVDIPGVDVDMGVNRKGNPDVDVTTNGTDATPRQ